MATVSPMVSKKMITATIVLKKEHIADFIDAAKPMIESSNAESGCESYMFYQDPYDKTRFIAIEYWKDQAAIDSHNSSTHFKSFINRISPWQSVPAEVKVIDIVIK